jgi:hypothetical protein
MIDDRPVVVSALEIPDDSATERRYRVPEGAIAEAVAGARRRDPRLGYIGEWHSHPSGSGPSTLDVATMLGARGQSGAPEPVLILVTPTDEGAARLMAFVATSDDLRPADICVCGGLPSESEKTQAEAV